MARPLDEVEQVAVEAVVSALVALFESRASPVAQLLIEPPHHLACTLDVGCFRHQLLLPRPYLVLTKQLKLDIQCQRGASVKIGWKYLDD